MIGIARNNDRPSMTSLQRFFQEKGIFEHARLIFNTLALFKLLPFSKPFAKISFRMCDASKHKILYKSKKSDGGVCMRNRQ